MQYVLILAIALACVSCEENAFGFLARTNKGSALLHQTRQYGGSTWGGCVCPNCPNCPNCPYGRKKRSTERERFKVSIQANPCKFDIYDANQDEAITFDEFEAIFGDGDATKELAEALDKSGDGKVDEEEFKVDIHKFVEGC